MNAQQSYLRSFTPVLAKQSAHFLENFGIELCRSSQAMSTGNGGEIFITEFELDGARMQLMLAQPAPHHLRKPHQRRFDLPRISGVFVVSVFVADRLGIAIGSDLGIKPSTSIFAAGLAGQRQTPLAKMFFKKSIVKPSQIADLPDAQSVQILFGDFSHAGDIAHIKRSEKLCLLPGNDPQNSVRFGFSR